MAERFKRTGFLRMGYKRPQVDEFFSRAREAYERPLMEENGMTPMDVRRAAFDLARNGYAPDVVDTAMDRLETAFASRLRDQYVRSHGQEAWKSDLAQRAKALYPRLQRKPKERFSKPGFPRRGYDRKQVDALMARMIAFFDTGSSLTVDDIRAAEFKRSWAFTAYEESSVDAYLAKALDIFLGIE